MKEICHIGSDGEPLAATGMDDCALDNRMAPVVRVGMVLISVRNAGLNLYEEMQK